jgi:uncharacterized protein involved in outer membrane biogenesis
MLVATLMRGRRFVVATASVIALLLLALWLVLPLWLRGFVEAQGSAALGRQVRIEAMHINPLTLTVSVDQVVISGPKPAARPLLRLARAEFNLDSRSLWRRAPVVEAVELHAPEVNLTRLADGRYDIDDVLGRFKPAVPNEDSEPARFAVYNLRITDGQVRFDDQPRGRLHQVRNLQLGLPFLSNLDDAVDIVVQPHLAFDLDDTRFDTGALATPFARERAGSLTLKSGDIDLADWLPYLPADLAVRPTAGTVAVDIALQFKAPPGTAPEVALSGSLRAAGVRLADDHGKTWAEWAGLTVQLTDVQPLRRQLRLGAVELDRLDLQAWRDREGRVNWLGAAASTPTPTPTPTPAADTAAPAAAWDISLSRLTLKDSRLQWRDEAVQPRAAMAIENLQVRLDDVRWPLVASAPAARLNAEGRFAAAPGKQRTDAPAPAWQLRGDWTSAVGSIQARANDWPLASVGPYLAPWLKPQLDGRLGFDATARWTGLPGATAPTLQLADLSVSDFKATFPGDARPAMRWKQLRIGELVLDPAQRLATLARVDWQQPALRARRDASGSVDVLAWWLPPDAGAAAAPDGAPWRLQLQQASIDDGQLAWQDAAAGGTEPVALELQRLKLDVHQVAWPAEPKAPSRMQGSAQISASGSSTTGALSWQGELGLAPISWRGTARVERFPLHAVAAYAAASLPVAIGRAEAGWTGQVAASVAPAGLSLAMKGDARLTDLRLYPLASGAVSAGDELVSWQALELPAVQIAMAPGQRPRLELGEARLSDFYARLMVNEAGHFNLAELNATGAGAAPTQASAVAAAAAASASGAAPATPPSVAAASEPAFDLSVAGLQLANGRIDFSDHFVRPHYSAALSELNGRVGAFRTGTRDMAPIELHGRVAGTAQLELRGAVNPMAKPLALDLQARASELELAPLSPYAGKYAGYAIERGKLTMAVSYRIDGDGQLAAKNQVVLNQLTFGDRIESPEATKLPVLLAVALLKDRDGVIDLDLPIGGSLNDPEFSIGGVVLKLIANLLTKAVTSPFALLAGGGSEDLSLVEFEPGTARLSAAAAPVLDQISRSLAERPSLQLTVSGAADPQTERDAMQKAQLQERLSAEWRKDGSQAGTTADAAQALAGPDVDQRDRLVRRLYAASKLPNKPRNLVGLEKDIPVSEMETLLRSAYLVSTDQARELALQRGLAVRDALIAKGLPSERLFLAAPKLRVPSEDNGHWTPRVQLSLATH